MALKAQQYQVLKTNDTKALGTSLLIIPELRVLLIGADQKARGLWERDCNVTANTPPPLANSCSGSRFDPEPRN